MTRNNCSWGRFYPREPQTQGPGKSGLTLEHCHSTHSTHGFRI